MGSIIDVKPSDAWRSAPLPDAEYLPYMSADQRAALGRSLREERPLSLRAEWSEATGPTSPAGRGHVGACAGVT